MRLFTLKALRYFLFWLLAIPYAVTAIAVCIVARLNNNNRNDPRIVFGPSAILNSKYWNKSLRSNGYKSNTIVMDLIKEINKVDDWDVVLSIKYKWASVHLIKLLAFLVCIIKYDVFVFYNSGFYLGGTPIWWMEKFFFVLGGKKTIVFSHGGDSYVYGWIRSPLVLHGLLMSYPQFARKQSEVAERVNYWVKNADIYISMVMVADGIGRSDVITPSYLFLDGKEIRPSRCFNGSTGIGAHPPVVIVHCPNHTGFKGTEFIESAINELKEDGYNIDYRRLEGLKNDEIIRIVTSEADILVDQLLFSGYALNATEGLAAGVVVVGNLEDQSYVRPMRLWSFLEECPIVSSSPEDIKRTLHGLITRPQLRRELSSASRKYFEKYHDLDSSQYLFEKCLDYLYLDSNALKNTYHPLFSGYVMRSPKIKTSLVNNRIAV